MKIDPTNNQLVVNKKNDNSGRLNLGRLSVDSATEETKAKEEDRVNISTSSRLYQRAMELATIAPDVRSEKVADLTARIAAGTYKVSSEELAQSIIRKSVSEIV
ncbi:MAG: flagellar biosynthesis anti-sigma factor FlgM [Deltaproteobacteria bacterium]|jgi:negative regulator of flagellin synthesis FlgM|nr:flagellar biosynthesis anti-sigma factor FlgM [Deltaproteobacteria bacterium]